MKEKFTPGPWTFDSDDLGTWINCSDAAPIAKMGSSTNYNKEANARLIAAAPEMYHELVEAMKTLNEVGLLKDADKIRELLNRITS